jgi:hypothetical protein
VTSKAEQQTGPEVPEMPSEAGAAVGAGATLPSIVVDPTLLEEKAEQSAPEAADHNVSAGHDDEPAPDEPAGDEPAGDELSFAQAERFAASIRASWEPTPGDQLAAASPSHQSEGSVSEDSPDVGPHPLSSVPGAAQRRNALVLTALAVLGFAAMVALALSSTKPAPRQAWQPETDSPPRPAPAQPAPTPALPAGAQPPAETASAHPTQQGPAGIAEIGASVATEGQEDVAAPSAADLGPAASSSAEQSSAKSDPPAPAVDSVAASAPAPSEPRVASLTIKPAAPQPPPERQLVHIRVSTRPAEATLTLDGRPVQNPYDVRMERGGGDHVLEASAAGFKSRSLRVDFDRDRSVTLRLRKQRSPGEGRAKRAPAAKPAPSGKGAGFVSESPY